MENKELYNKTMKQLNKIIEKRRWLVEKYEAEIGKRLELNNLLPIHKDKLKVDI